MKQDISYMEICLTLAERALAKGDPPVGAILVCGDQVIGQGIESGKSTGDITNHAEILVVRNAITNGYQRLLEQSAKRLPSVLFSC